MAVNARDGYRTARFRFLKDLRPGDDVNIETAAGADIAHYVAAENVVDIARPGPPPPQRRPQGGVGECRV